MDDFYQVKELISSGQYEEAENLLMSLQLTEDQAQWNYLMAQVSMGKGWLEYAKKPIRQNPKMKHTNSFMKRSRNSVREKRKKKMPIMLSIVV